VLVVRNHKHRAIRWVWSPLAARSVRRFKLLNACAILIGRR